MITRGTLYKRISWILVFTLLFPHVPVVCGAEISEATPSTECQTVAPTEPVPWEAAKVTEATLPVAEETILPAATQPGPLPTETGPLPEAATLPEETAMATQAPETQPASAEESLSTEPTEEPLPTLVSTEPFPAETRPPSSPETLPAETEATRSTEPPPTLPPESTEPQPVQILTIAQAQAMLPGTQGITIQGTVVYSDAFQAVLQDATGGIRLSFPEDPGVLPGEILLVTGTRTGGLAVEDFEVLGHGELPSQESTLLDAPEELRVQIRSARVQDGQISQGGFSLTLAGAVPLSEDSGPDLDVWGVILDGCFYADATAPAQTAAGSSEAAAQVPASPWNIYFGQLHAHTEITKPVMDPADAFAYGASLDNMDFFAITNASDSFDNAIFGTIGSPFGSLDWTNGQAAASNATSSSFLAIFGYEMAWPRQRFPGHVSTFFTPGWQAWTQTGMETLDKYCAQLASEPLSVSQFNHPGHAYGDFHQFSQYDPAQDQVIHLLELDPEGEDPTVYYDMALQNGWHLAPSFNGGNIPEKAGQIRTAILAEGLTQEHIAEAMQSLRVYATRDPDLQVAYWLNGEIMGSTLGPAEDLEARVFLQDPTNGGGYTVEVVTENGPVQKTDLSSAGLHTIPITEEARYYYLRILREGQIVAVTAPVWVEDYGDIGIQSFASSETKPMEGQEITLSLELYNQELTPFSLERLAVYAGEAEAPLQELLSPGTLLPLDSLCYQFPAVWETPGPVTFRAEVTGTIAGYRRSFSQTLTLTYQAKEAEPLPIAAVRQGVLGNVYRVNGYITAGNDNPYTTFPGTLYVQDDSGGIAVLGDPPDTLQVGRPVCITGILACEGGNLVLKLLDCALTEATYYRYAPETSPNKVATDSDAHGGELMQVEGDVVSLQKTPDGKGLTRLTLKDTQGDLATVVIDSSIRSGAYGTNTLTAQIKKGRTVRAIGLVHRDDYGTTVLRARNCDEVVYVPAKVDLSNPKTADPLWFLPRWLFPWLSY